MAKLITIRTLATSAGVTSGTIRRWEKEGRIPPAVRLDAGPTAPRYFPADTLDRVLVRARTADAPKKGPRNG